jgi:hypothetical protein
VIDMKGNEAYQAYVARLQARHGAAFSDADLCPEFRALYGHKVTVRFSCGTLKHGRISGTTGWRPALMVAHHNAHGSSWLLGPGDELVRDKGV